MRVLNLIHRTIRVLIGQMCFMYLVKNDFFKFDSEKDIGSASTAYDSITK